MAYMYYKISYFITTKISNKLGTGMVQCHKGAH